MTARVLGRGITTRPRACAVSKTVRPGWPPRAGAGDELAPEADRPRARTNRR
jgi:hypothetical protein